MISLLLVEDTEIFRVGLKLILEKVNDFQIVADVGDGKSALKKVDQLKPEIVLLDIGLPDVDGITIARSIKAKAPETKILILTSNEVNETVLDALDAGVEGFCVKHNALTHLELAIRAVVEGKGWLDPQVGTRLAKFAPKAKDRAVARYALSSRELDVIQLLVEGLSNQQIAERLNLSPETIKSHLRRIMDKLLVSDRTQVAVKALREGIL